MDIDIYQPCPCNSGKKIKFCCAKDITADLNQILSKSSAGQSAAAIDLIDRVVEREGQRDCLSIIKTHILLSSEDVEKADETNKLFLAAAPKHPIGLQHRALIKVGQGEIEPGVKYLQKAMNAIPGNEIPISFANAFRTVGIGLLHAGHLLAARAHFNYSLMLKDNDEQAQGLLIQTYQLPEISMLLKHDLRLDPVPEDESLPWFKHYANVMKALDAGQFSFALKILKKADEESPNVPEIKRGIAILTTNLAIEDEISNAWRDYSRLPDLNRWDAVEAEALAQMIGNQDLSAPIDYVSIEFELNDLDRANEAAIANSQMIAHDTSQIQVQSGPPPRSAFAVIDKDEVKEAASLTFDNVPNAIGDLMMFGKQTDRAARCELVVAASNETTAIEIVKAAFTSEIQGEPERKVVGQLSQLEQALTWNWHLPQDIEREQYEELNEKMKEYVTLERWAEVPFEMFGGKSPQEACKDESNSIALEALMVQFEASADQQAEESNLINRLRDKLGLPHPEPVDIEALGDRLVSPVRQKYLDVTKLKDEQLIGLQSEAMTIGNMPVLKRVIPEVLGRPSTTEKIPHDLCHSVMAQLAEGEEARFEHIHQARNIAKQNNRPFGVYLVQELELSILHGKRDKVPVILREIETNHMHEPNVEYQLVRLLQKFGLIDPNGRMPGPPAENEGSAPPADAGGIWTPGADEPASAEPEESDSKLWIPGQ
jgi:tetratricopeptide (TPR) repeat protein